MLLVRSIAIINQKGGVGKTTTVANLGAAVATLGKRVCLVDLDPQAHLTLHFGVEPSKSQLSIYESLTVDAPLASAAVQLRDGLALIPSSIDLAAAEVELAARVGREQILSDRIAAADLPHDLLMIDCPPSLGLLTLNALAAAEEVYIPLQPHFLALQGLGKLLETVALVQRRINPSLRVSGVMLCLYDMNTRLASEVMADLESFVASARSGNTPWAGMQIFRTVIRRNVKLAECPSYGMTIFDYAPNSHGAEDYRALAEEFLERLDGPPAADATGGEATPLREARASETAGDRSVTAPAPSPDPQPGQPQAPHPPAQAESASE